MFTKIGDFIKPLLPTRDKMPTEQIQRVAGVDKDTPGQGDGRSGSGTRGHETQDLRDETIISIEALKAMLADEQKKHAGQGGDDDRYDRSFQIIESLMARGVKDIYLKRGQSYHDAIFEAGQHYGGDIKI